MKRRETETIAQLLDRIDTVEDQAELNEILEELSNNRFFALILDRLNGIELKVHQYDNHEHKANGDIVLRP